MFDAGVVESGVEHHDGKREDVGGVLRLYGSFFLVVSVVLESKDLHYFINLLRFSLRVNGDK